MGAVVNVLGGEPVGGAELVHEGAVHLLGLQAELAGFAGLQHPVVGLPDTNQVLVTPGGDGLGNHGQIAACQR